ncbi:MAG: efflux RND transporter periplasmic adaptor subunit, partial [Burkholderiales bacterium]|nr:efflux RND transporter periplasmic adaptor subunit [Burkholderiales bacterium]
GKDGKSGPSQLEFAAADLAQVQMRSLNQAIPVTGTLKPLNHTTLKSKIGAVVQTVKVREGDVVRAGDVLATFDTSNIAAQLHEQQGNLEMARAQLGLDERTYKKNQALLKQGFISENAFDTSQNAMEVSRAKVKAAQAQVEIAANAMNDTVLRAPIGGVIGKRMIEPGGRVEVNTDLLSIVDLSEMLIQVAVPTTDIAHVQVGQTATFKVDGFNDETFTGTVKRIDPEAQDGSRAILVYLSVKNPKGALRGGMFAKGTLAMGQSTPRLTIPAGAVMDGSGQAYVYYIDKDKVARANITVGATDERSGLVEVKSGLAEGTTVVATKMEAVKPGTIAIIRQGSAAKKG